ncbi:MULTISPECIES: helix-turn-helix transcriptional regulator [Pandoraea]|uniref:DNA-binding protein n=1 Tax=Pandoraea communis TaxID=2508297 RepID=A0A5E4XXS1_9BURK|nr:MULTISPECIES: hypothetical protein [Pandoraea]CFB61446.1 hypothetical protein LMG16407_01505 [Pandoraea apista]VVE41164.1 DNA-binding protein [Pandoraea communis]
MTNKKTPQELIEFSVQLHAQLRCYLDMPAWTPVMGAMLLAGLRPEVEAGCTEIPTDGWVGLEGIELDRGTNGRFIEARRILREWNDWCEEEGQAPAMLPPIDFIAWCVDYEIKERFAVFSSFPWIDAFKGVVGYPGENVHVPFEVALYAAKTAQPLNEILSRLDAMDRRALDASRLLSAASAPITAAIPISPSNPLRQFLTTEEFAAALGIAPQTIRKGYSTDGHYCDVRPTKLPNRRLAWPTDAVDRILQASRGNK